jgi:transcriptional regulator with XRE-family HTH domain
VPRERIGGIYLEIGDRIRRLRDRKGLSQKGLTDDAQLNRTSICNIEHGKQRLPIDRLCMIAVALGAELNEIMPSVKAVKDMTQNYDFDDLTNETLNGEEKSLIKELITRHENTRQN